MKKLSTNYTKQICTELFEKHCNTRDESHGIIHANRVLHTALEIAENAKINNSRIILTEREKVILHASALLHDFADHKYEQGTYLKKIMDEFLTTNFEKEDKNLILGIIDRISFSKEVKNGSSTWLKDLGTRGLLIRNLVSDSDKIDATGKIGLERRIEYTKTVKEGITNENLVKEVDKHIKEKIGIIDIFCRTDYGKIIASKKIIELNNTFTLWKKKILLIKD